MLVVAASALHGAGLPSGSLEDMHAGLDSTLGTSAAVAFALALLVPGLTASSVGTYSGQVVMDGFLRRRVSLALHRIVTMAPTPAAGVDPTRALVLSQVVLSFGIPFAPVPARVLIRRRDVTGRFANRPLTTICGVAVATVISALNVFLLVRTSLPGPG